MTHGLSEASAQHGGREGGEKRRRHRDDHWCGHSEGPDDFKMALGASERGRPAARACAGLHLDCPLAALRLRRDDGFDGQAMYLTTESLVRAGDLSISPPFGEAGLV